MSECPGGGAHEEDIGLGNIGVCRKCGRTVQYSNALNEKPVVLEEGSVPGAAEGTPKRGRLSRADKKELVEIGPEAYAAKHGYSTKGVYALKRVYNRQLTKKGPLPSLGSGGSPEAQPIHPIGSPRLIINMALGTWEVEVILKFRILENTGALGANASNGTRIRIMKSTGILDGPQAGQ